MIPDPILDAVVAAFLARQAKQAAAVFGTKDDPVWSQQVRDRTREAMADALAVAMTPTPERVEAAALEVERVLSREIGRGVTQAVARLVAEVALAALQGRLEHARSPQPALVFDEVLRDDEGTPYAVFKVQGGTEDHCWAYEWWLREYQRGAAESPYGVAAPVEIEVALQAVVSAALTAAAGAAP